MVLGLGLGYHIEKIIDGNRDKKFRVCVVEKDPALVKKVFGLRDLGAVLSGAELFAGAGKNLLLEGFSRLITSREIDKVIVVGHQPSVKLHPEYYRDAADLVRNLMNTRKVSLNTLFFLGGKWQENIIKNLNRFFSLPGVNSLAGLFSGVPALIVSSGPSLNEAAGFLRDAGDRALVICVDSALKTLLANGIRPHIVVSIDAQEETWLHLKGAESPGTAYLFDMVSPPVLFEKVNGNKFITTFGNPLITWAEQFTEPPGRLKAGGSVTSSAFDLALLSGASPLFFIGADMCYPHYMYYARDNYFTERSLELSGKFHSHEMLHRGKINAGGALYIEKAKVYSSSNMLAYKNWLEWELEARGAEAYRPKGFLPVSGITGMSAAEFSGKFLSREHPLREKIADAAGCKQQPEPGRFALEKRKLLDGIMLIVENAKKARASAEKILAGDMSDSNLSSLNAAITAVNASEYTKFIELDLQNALAYEGARFSGDIDLEHKITVFTSIEKEGEKFCSLLGRADV